MNHGFLPISRKEMEERGWNQVDFVYVSGDAYVDHPSFGHAIITRLLEAHGFRVGIIAQPDWRKKESITVFGAAGIYGVGGKYGFHGQPLFCIKEKTAAGFLYTGRSDGKETGLCSSCVRQSDPSDI